MTFKTTTVPQPYHFGVALLLPRGRHTFLSKLWRRSRTPLRVVIVCVCVVCVGAPTQSRQWPTDCRYRSTCNNLPIIIIIKMKWTIIGVTMRGALACSMHELINTARVQNWYHSDVCCVHLHQWNHRRTRFTFLFFRSGLKLDARMAFSSARENCCGMRVSSI